MILIVRTRPNIRQSAQFMKEPTHGLYQLESFHVLPCGILACEITTHKSAASLRIRSTE